MYFIENKNFAKTAGFQSADHIYLFEAMQASEKTANGQVFEV